MRTKWKISILIIVIVLFGAISIGPIMSNVETPGYEVMQSQDKIEIRQFKPMVIAEVKISGHRENAISEGFRVLADYIFGNNIVQQTIAMTAPVQQQASRKIAMTSPTQLQSEKDSWLVSFIMPSEYSLDTLPKPTNNRINIKRIPSKKFVTITFSGTNSNENLKIHEKKLEKFIRAKNISVTGTSKYAFYNPPWTLPLMRRNEVMIEVQQ